MLLTQLLIQDPHAITDILHDTPPWVGALLAGLIVLGLSATRVRQVRPMQLALLPLAMLGLALWGVQSAFGASGLLAPLLILWALCFGVSLYVGQHGAAPAGTHYDAASQRVCLPGSWIPMGLILAVFLLKYVIGVQLALEPTLALHGSFAAVVSALYGLLSGGFAARSWRVLRLTARTALPA